MTITILIIAALIIGFLCLVIYLQRKTISSLERIVIKFQDDIVGVFHTDKKERDILGDSGTSAGQEDGDPGTSPG